MKKSRLYRTYQIMMVLGIAGLAGFTAGLISLVVELIFFSTRVS